MVLETILLILIQKYFLYTKIYLNNDLRSHTWFYNIGSKLMIKRNNYNQDFVALILISVFVIFWYLNCNLYLIPPQSFTNRIVCKRIRYVIVQSFLLSGFVFVVVHFIYFFCNFTYWINLLKDSHTLFCNSSIYHV